ncbi:MAG: 16S rRNA (cytosine(1402)-N(4))-methyltransferase RsmH [Coriobacteriales bacterium]|jgi:16S rRNA (cytosine1402-N4)-methyltransferase|nr:16S rRNA (cytosine(1402)-N(4))-methyltransferase RsmH [Coriobacteriales bacterium]
MGADASASAGADSAALTAEYRHTPVMLHEVRAALALGPGEVFCDCTLGGAGHSLALLHDIQPDGRLIGIDRDQQALDIASQRITATAGDVQFIGLHGNFADLDELLLETRLPGVDAFLFDFGVSSPQLDIPQRGFSYAQEAPLDMRMDPGQHTKTAAELLNSLNETELAWILRTYGEEKWAARIAAFVVKARQLHPLQTTGELAELVRAAIPASARREGGNPAKRTFQALRIAVNGELEAIESGLEAALRWLNPAGRIVAISYHSLEDRIVKEHFARGAKGCVCPPQAPLCVCGQVPIIARYAHKPLVPTSAEKQDNPRSRSAKLRWAVKYQRNVAEDNS